MKITAVRLFELSSLDPKLQQPLKPLVEHINQLSENLIRAARGELTLEDNIKGALLAATVSNDVESNFGVQAGSIIGVIPLRVESGNPIISFGWRLTDTNKPAFKIKFANTPAKGVEKVTLFVFFA